MGAPRKVPAQAIAAVSDLANHVELALSNSDVHRQLTRPAETDSLTGLANRATFNDALSAALMDETAGETSVLFIDLDAFKDVNDDHGHRAGDDLLREVAARLRRATRPADLCARLGGDEFAVVLRGTRAPAAAEVAQRVVEAITAPADLGTGLVPVGVSVGVATGALGSDPEQLLHRADAAMYVAKSRTDRSETRAWSTNSTEATPPPLP